MRIGFDVSATCGRRTGVGWYADRLVRAMAELAPENDYILFPRFGRIHHGELTEGTQLPEGRGKVAYPELNPAESEALWNELRKGRELFGNPEIVHATSYQAPCLPRTQLVYTVYDVTYWVVPEFTFEDNRAECQKGTLDAMKNAAGLLFISESCREEFERVFPGWLSDTRIPWAVTPLGPREHNSFPEGEASRAGNRDAWLFVGSLEPRKNIGTLLKALEIYWSRSENPVPLKLAGAGGWQTDVVKLRIQGLESKGMVKHLDYVSEEQLSELYRDAVAFLFPSWYEGFGLPILEAMSVGCPVITSDRTSLPEVGGDAVIYIDPSSPESIAEAMLRLENEPGLTDRLSEAGQKRAEEFTWEKTARLTLDFYEEVLQRRTLA